LTDIIGTQNTDYWTSSSAGADIANSNYPPYVVVSMWRRTG